MPVVRTLKHGVQERDLGHGELLASSFLKSRLTEDHCQNHHLLTSRIMITFQMEELHIRTRQLLNALELRSSRRMVCERGLQMPSSYFARTS